MLRCLAFACALILVVVLIAAVHDPAFAASAGAGGASADGSGHKAGAAHPSGAARQVKSGDAAGRLLRDPGSRESRGWFQRGFGGTRDPGWGYGFGPSLGGFGH